ncbi:Ribosomal large subunit pseudouridine synthase C [invertebrate metagenome]|uniref:Ribosomal large subunit pseudouridine synthase C n=1 Tax=invertebrate metagenome TaxID=1711999 RepID=A0A484H951_9ZZZZ
MCNVRFVTVTEEDSDLRLDRWFRRWHPIQSHSRLEKLLRTGQVRVDGRRARAGQRLQAGQRVRIPPIEEPSLPNGEDAIASRSATVQQQEAAALLRARVLYRDSLVLAIDKPAGLAVQGGPGMTRHLDAMLAGLCFEATERPRLVHRLDKDTSGVLLLARTAAAAAMLAEMFRSHTVHKVYWAVVAGVPQPLSGCLSAPLAKVYYRNGERVAVDEHNGKLAVTSYRVVRTVAWRAAWLELDPRTGRTHQLRAHCALLGTPILGDGKYGRMAAFSLGDAVTRHLHLHARALMMPNPAGGFLHVNAPLPPHMVETFALLGFREASRKTALSLRMRT